MVETVRQDAPRALQVLQPLGAQKKVEFQTELLAVAQKALRLSAQWTQPSAMEGELVSELGVLSRVRALLALPRAVEPLPASLTERAPVPWA